MAGVFDLELHDAPDSEFTSDDDENGTDVDTSAINVTQIEVVKYYF